jgi:FkbM family methyltransferase
MNAIVDVVKTRLKLLFANPYLTPAEKLRLMRKFGVAANEEMKRIIVQRRVTKGEEAFVRIGGRDFWVPASSDDSFVDGMAQVLGEMYVFPEWAPDVVALKPGDVYLDLGANIGTTTMAAATAVGKSGRVIALEPITHEILARNLHENGIDGVDLIAKAVSSQTGRAKMEVASSGIASRIGQNNQGVETLDVELTTIDTLVSELGLAAVDLIKMDIEGAEEDAILGAETTIANLRPRWSIASYHMDFKGEPQHPKLKKRLVDKGYEIIEIGQRHIYAF